MNDQIIQASFNSGEWSPKLFARVDLSKYRSGAALLENFFVDYRGGASTRPGTKYILQAYKSATAVRIIPFQASFEVGYVLEFGDHYIRFFFQGAPVLETPLAISAATQANPCVVTVVGNTYQTNDWIFVDGILGMTQLNGRYFKISNVAGNLVTLADVNGVPINSLGYTAYISGGTAARVYTISSPYAAADLRGIKYAQNVTQMILCHPSYAPYVLSLVTATNWTLAPITFGTTAVAPTIASLTPSQTLSTGAVYIYNSYVATSIDANGQESSPSPPVSLYSNDMRVVAGSIQVNVNPALNAVAYNFYKANVNYVGPVPAGASYGYIGSSKSTSFVDTNIAADFSQTPPIVRNPFTGSGVDSVLVTAPGTYTAVPTVTFTGAAPTIPAAAIAILEVQGTPTVGAGGSGYAANDTVTFADGVILIVNTETGGAVTSWKSVATPGSSPGAISSGPTPTNPVAQVSTSGVGTGVTANLVWGVGQVQVITTGAGYNIVPTVAFSAGAATATATLSATGNGNPSVPGFFQQRLVLAAPDGAPQTFYMSQPGAYFNFNISQITQADDSITGTLVSGQLNTIRSMVPQPSGLLMFTDRNSWLINGGSGQGSAISPTALVANAQSFNGVSDVPPIIANFDVLYVQSKGSIVRDSAYNIYANVYTGTDISAIASHLFADHTVDEWAWAEEPFKIVWAIRDDGVVLTLTFLKEQEFIGWAHSITENGEFKSVCSIVESTAIAGEVDAVYFIVERDIDGNTVKYIERLAERSYPNGVEDAWCVDCGIGYSGPPEDSFSGAEFLAGETVTGLADGVIIEPFVMPASGAFTLTSMASKVVVGIAFEAKLQTLAVELGDPTIQGKVKKINSVDARVADTLGLRIGQDFDHMTPMKDLVRGNVSSMLTGQQDQMITNLVNGDARTFLSPAYTVPGQYCIDQINPYPATVLGVIPNITVGDDGRRG